MCKVFRYRVANFLANRFSRCAQKLDSIIKQKQLNKVRKLLASQKPECLRRTKDYLTTTIIICHAGGGVGGERYLNTLSTFSTYYGLGCRCFEYDITFDNAGRYVLSHDAESASKYTIEDCLNLLRDYEDIEIILDLKDVELSAFVQFLKDAGFDGDKRIVVQVKNEDEIKSAFSVSDSVQLLLVNMITSDFLTQVKLCLRYGIRTVSVPFALTKTSKLFDLYLENDIRVFAYTVNSVEDYKRLKSQGVQGVYSDYLTQEQLERELGI